MLAIVGILRTKATPLRSAGERIGTDLYCLLINLDRSTQRLHSARIRFSSSELEFHRVPAVDGRTLDSRTAGLIDERAALWNMGRTIIPGEIATYLSHTLALRTFLASSHPCCLILEDDAAPHPDTRLVLERAVDHLDRHFAGAWRVLHCGDVRLRISSFVTNLGVGTRKRELRQAHYFPMGAFALCWTRIGAELFLRDHQRITAPYDNQVQNWLCRSGGGFAISPGLIGITDAASDIDGTPAGHKPFRSMMGRHRFASLAKQRRLWTNRGLAWLHKVNRCKRWELNCQL